jgi:hypothetical protein
VNKHIILGALLVVAVWACGGGNKAKPDSSIDAPGGSDACGSANAFGSCPSGNKCTWIIDSDDPTADNCQGTFLGHVGCAPVGTVALAGQCDFDACNDGGGGTGTTTGPCAGLGSGAACTSTNSAGSSVAGTCSATGACQLADGACADGLPHVGADNCGTGLYCISRRCEQLCSVNGGQPTCDSQHSCSEYNDTFGTGDATPIAGLCDERCDPNTQRALSDGAEACRSTDPAQVGSGSAEVYPEFGCYEDDNADPADRLVDFTCSDTPFGRSTGPGSGTACISATVTDPAQDRQDCTVAESCTEVLGTQTFSIPNGCAPGYTNLISDQTGSTTLICSAYCSPLDADTTQPGNAIGNGSALGKAPSDTAAKAGRATCNLLTTGGKAADAGETCIYGWQFALDSSTGLLPTNSPFNIDTLGICFENAKYDYDPTGGSNLDKEEPSCATLLEGQEGVDTACGSGSVNCGSDATCILGSDASQCHIVDVACGSGSGKDADGDDKPGNEADCFALFHGCYNSVEEGAVGSGSGSASVAPHNRPMVTRSPALRRMADLTIRPEGNARFRRPGGIH